MKLKTMKDIELEHDCHEYCECKDFEFKYSESIKAEAIKWVKEDKEDLILHYGCNSYKSTYNYELMKRWMKRLNITGEDLITTSQKIVDNSNQEEDLK